MVSPSLTQYLLLMKTNKLNFQMIRWTTLQKQGQYTKCPISLET